MTAAHIYARTGYGPHPCPRSWHGDPHNLIRDPNRKLGSGGWVCPHEYSVELADAHREHQERERAIERERIAQEIAAEQIDTLPFTLATSGLLEQVSAAIFAAALQALTHAEKES